VKVQRRISKINELEGENTKLKEQVYELSSPDLVSRSEYNKVAKRAETWKAQPSDGSKKYQALKTSYYELDTKHTVLEARCGDLAKC